MFPTPEGHQLQCPPPRSTYGFQKLACEYFARGAHEQYKLPYTIVRPFNCVGIGERRALGDKDDLQRQRQLAMSHVVPDLVQKVLKGRIRSTSSATGNQVRHYTYGGDLARASRLHRAPEGAQRGLQHLHGRVDDGARARGGDLGEGPQGSATVPHRQ